MVKIDNLIVSGFWSDERCLEDLIWVQPER